MNLRVIDAQTCSQSLFGRLSVMVCWIKNVFDRAVSILKEADRMNSRFLRDSLTLALLAVAWLLCGLFTASAQGSVVCP